MNKKHLIFAVAYGVLMSQSAIRAMIGRGESVHIAPNAEGEYLKTIEDDSFKIDVREIGNGILEVTIEPRWRFSHYLLGAGLAILLGTQHYRWSQSEKKDDGNSTASNDLPNEDPLYEEFLQEDSNRRLFPRSKLEEEFQAWKSDRNAPDETPV